MHHHHTKAVKQLIYEKHVQSAGLCGTYSREIMGVLKIEFSTFKRILEDLIKSGFAIYRPGQHGDLIFYQPENQNQIKETNI